MIVFLSSIMWYIIGAIVITIMILLENEKEGWSTTLLSLGIGLAAFLHYKEILDFLSHNILTSVLFTIFYVVIGVLWSFVKWNYYVKDSIRRFNDIKERFLSKEGEITSSNVQGLIDKVNKAYSGYVSNTGKLEEIKEDIGKKVTPETKDKKSIIVAWISYWPMSFIATLLNNPFRRFFEFIYDSVSGYYDKIANKHKAAAIKF